MQWNQLRWNSMGVGCLGVLGCLLFHSLLGAGVGLADETENAEASAPGEIRFVGKNSMATAKGIFHRWSFEEVRYRAEPPGVAEVRVVVDLESVDTGIGRRDRHLRTEDFFEIEKYPTARLRFYDIRAAESSEPGERYVATLDFDLHGVQKTYPDFEFEVLSREPIRVRGAFEFDRMDFGVGKRKSWNPMSIKEEIPITFEAELPPPSGGG